MYTLCSGVINTLINFSSLNLVLILAIFYNVFVLLVFKQYDTQIQRLGITPTLGLFCFAVMNKNVRVHICARARQQLDIATVGTVGEGLVESLGRFSSRVNLSAGRFSSRVNPSAGHPSGAGAGAVFTVSVSAAAHSSQLGLKEGQEEEGRRQAW